MFSGIIAAIGILADANEGQLTVKSVSIAERAALGASIAVSGVCLTVADKDGETLVFNVMPETLRKTTLGGKRVGDAVNLESSLRAGDEIGGHFVYGHADGAGVVIGAEKENDAMLATIRLPHECMRYMAPQGSVAVDGVSLTVARLSTDMITVSLVPYTMAHTTLDSLQIGDKVNIECDMLAKYVQGRNI